MSHYPFPYPVSRNYARNSQRNSYTNTGNSLKNAKNSISLRSHTNSLIRPSARFPNVLYIHIASEVLVTYQRPRPFARDFPSHNILPFPYIHFPPYPHSTYSSMSNYMVFVLIRRLRAFISFDFVMELAGFDSPLIYLTSVISRYSYT